MYLEDLTMDLFSEILVKAIENARIEVTFPDLQVAPTELVELRSYEALRKIKSIIEDETLDDPDCFHQIEEIVSTLEFLGSGGGVRHDFG